MQDLKDCLRVPERESGDDHALLGRLEQLAKHLARVTCVGLRGLGTGPHELEVCPRLPEGARAGTE